MPQSSPYKNNIYQQLRLSNNYKQEGSKNFSHKQQQQQKQHQQQQQQQLKSINLSCFLYCVILISFTPNYCPLVDVERASANQANFPQLVVKMNKINLNHFKLEKKVCATVKQRKIFNYIIRYIKQLSTQK